jgi:hypothetical protein
MYMSESLNSPSEKKRGPLTHFMFLCDSDDEDGQTTTAPLILPIASAAFVFDEHGVCTVMIVGSDRGSPMSINGKIRVLSAEEVVNELKRLI